MIIIFGGTTEGRKAASVLDEAGTPYFYSTRGSEQKLDLVHGTRLAGAMDAAAMTAFCRDRAIRLVVDAAHPFATELHRNIALSACEAGVPLVRYERLYPPRTPDIHWCRDYDDAILQLRQAGIERLLALTGVQTIGRLRPFWEAHTCWFRILDRESSRAIASKEGFPTDMLIAAPDDDILSTPLPPTAQAIITKESGLSGGFNKKVAAAQRAGMEVFAVQRPPLPEGYAAIVDGPHGLRRAVERLVPEFFPLKSGLTTGTCATAAVVAAARRVLTGETPDAVDIRLPDGETLSIGVGYGEDYAFCIKDAGDDPDVTDGLEIRATIGAPRQDALSATPSSPIVVAETPSVSVFAGKGIGRFTLPGFDFPAGEPAVNRVPRQMMADNLERLPQNPSPIALTLSIPLGENIARRTFNPRLGIEGGISVIGVSGIVKPFSEEAFLESIHKCLVVAMASGAERIVIGSGAKSEDALRAHYPALPVQAFVQYGNYIGQTLSMADELGAPRVTLGVMLGKAVKLAAGQLDTHSRRGTFDRDFLGRLLAEAGCHINEKEINLVRELWQLLPTEEVDAFVRVVIGHCEAHCRPLLPNGELTLLLVDEQGRIWGDGR